MKVLTYNIKGETRDFFAKRWTLVGRAINQIDPDVIFFQEYGMITDYRTPLKNEYLNDYNLIGSFNRCKIFAKNGICYPVHTPIVNDTYQYENLLFPYYNIVLVDVPNVGQQLFVNVHLSENGYKYDDTSRAQQISRILDYIKELGLEEVPTVLGGDLNAVPGSDPYHTILDEGFVDTRGNDSPKPYTWHGFKKVKKPKDRIDYIFTRGIENTTSYIVYSEEATASDHYPLSVTIVNNFF